MLTTTGSHMALAPTTHVNSVPVAKQRQPHTPTAQPMWMIDNDDPALDITKHRDLLRSTSDSKQLTPRKRALARKASGFDMLDNKLPSPPPSAESQLDQLDIGRSSEDRSSLFKLEKAEIYLFQELSDNISDSKSQGRILGHGKFEIFQLHQKKVSYLQCGSVVHPILPRLKMLKISNNQFILPLSNPERYWRIVLLTQDGTLVKNFEEVLKGICLYRNLFIHTESTNALSTPTSFKTESPPTISLSGSLTSISTAVACLNLESDTSTFVDDKPDQSVLLHRIDSKASSLDMALDSFLEEPEMTNYYTPDASFVLPQESSPFSHTLGYLDSIPKRRTQTRSSRSASLYQSETSWMDPSDDLMTSSTPNTQRYIKLNLDPNISQKHMSRRDKRIITEPILGKREQDTMPTKRIAGHRYSSYDVLSILQSTPIDEIDEGVTSFKGFLKSFL